MKDVIEKGFSGYNEVPFIPSHSPTFSTCKQDPANMCNLVVHHKPKKRGWVDFPTPLRVFVNSSPVWPRPADVRYDLPWRLFLRRVKTQPSIPTIPIATRIG